MISYGFLIYVLNTQSLRIDITASEYYIKDSSAAP